MIEIVKPRVDVEDIVEGKESKFTAEPLERGFGQTLGNSLRRILLGALPGAAPVGIRITGVNHEFSTIEGVKEDVTEIILNIKSLAVKAHTAQRDFKQIATIRKYDAGVVTAADIQHSSDIEILNPDMYICTLDEGAKLEMDITIGVGRGYVSAQDNKMKPSLSATSPWTAFSLPWKLPATPWKTHAWVRTSIWTNSPCT